MINKMKSPGPGGQVGKGNDESFKMERKRIRAQSDDQTKREVPKIGGTTRKKADEVEINKATPDLQRTSSRFSRHTGSSLPLANGDPQTNRRSTRKR
jgi:hypothetical protein